MGIIKSWNLFLCAYNGGQATSAAHSDPHCTPPCQPPARPAQSCRPPPPGDAFHLTIRNILCARKNRRLGRRNNNNNSYKQNKQFETRAETKTGTRQHQKGKRERERGRAAMQWRSLRRVECIGPKCPQRIFEFCQYLRSHSKIILIENLGVNWGDSCSVPLGLSNANAQMRMAVDKAGQILQLDRCLSEWTERMRRVRVWAEVCNC